MIKKIILENFFSFGKTEIELNKDTNVLIGINGSGKSNFIKAIRLLYEGLVGRNGFEYVFVKEWGGFDVVANFSKTRAEEIKITYVFDKTLHTFNELNEDILYVISIPRLGNDFFLIDYLFVESVNTLEGEFSEQKLNIRSLSLKNKLSSLGNSLVYYSLDVFIKKIKTYTQFDTSFKSPIRGIGSYTIEQQLASNGENLAAILQSLKNNHALEYEKIEEALTKINPMFKDISFDYIGSRFLLVLREKKLSRSIPIEHISDGTLRFLALLTILYNPERGSVVCLDEPEMGLHPDMINTLCEGIKYASKQGTQFIIATHSPLVLNAFELEDILIFEKDKDNQSVVITKTEEDFEEWGNQFLAGQLWLSGKLGGTRW